MLQKEKKADSEKTVEKDEPVTIEQLEKAWNDYVANLKAQGKNLEYNALNQKVSFSDDLCIRLTVPNSFQSLTVEGIRQDLLGHLRNKLKNKNISLLTEIEKHENKKMIYTNKEKFEHLAGKYPILKKLRSRFDLDADF